MADPLGSLLRQTADRLCEPERTPDVGGVRARVRPHSRPLTDSRRAWAPALAALAVAAVVGVVQFIPQGGSEQQPLTIPPPPTLGKVVPPTDVRTRLGAPGGQVNGPAVADADLLAVAAAEQDGLSLQTVGVVRPRPKPDAEGRPLIDRCVYTYSEPELTVLDGRCQWATPAAGIPEPDLTLRLRGAPGATFLIGTAPVGTAAVRLQTADEDLLVPVASAGQAWQERPRYVAWWPRVATTVTALNGEGRELARTRLPSPEPVRTAADDPELGTIELDADTTRLFTRFTTRGGPPPPELVEPKRVDVLAQLRLGPNKTLYTYGFAEGGNRCVVKVLQDFSGDADNPGGGGGGCGPADQPNDLPPIRVQRSFSAGPGEPGEQLLSGSAPAGTTMITLTAPGVPEKNVKAYDSGPRWDNRAYFIADWPSAAPTKVRAVDAEGRTLAVWNDKGLNPDQFDPAYLEAFARCLEEGGVEVTRHPQPQGAGPAYEYGDSKLTTAELEALEQKCKAGATRTN